MTMRVTIQNGLSAFLALPLAAASLTLASCGETRAQTECPPGDTLVTDVPEVYPGYLSGYLKDDQVPKSLNLLPPPPEANSSAFAHDEAMSKTAFGLKGTPRWDQATIDADISNLSDTITRFSCALGVPISDADTPNLSRLMRRVFWDAGIANDSAKNHYKRERPFVIHNEGTCTPASEDALKKDFSYPSGHSASGQAWALALVEVAPDREEALMARGRHFAESRMVCNAHWQSDTLQGRAMAGIVIARLRSESAYRADVVAARKDVAAARAKGLKPNADCAKESAALASFLPGAL